MFTSDGSPIHQDVVMADSLFEVPLLDDVGWQDVGLVGVAGGAGELAEVVAEPEGVGEGSVHLHAAVVAEVALLQHRLLHVPAVDRRTSHGNHKVEQLEITYASSNLFKYFYM